MPPISVSQQAAATTPVSSTSPSTSLVPDTVNASDDESNKAIGPLGPTQLASTQAVRPRQPQRKKWALLAVFSLAFIIDCWNNSAMYIFTNPISGDLEIVVSQNSWIITSYSANSPPHFSFGGRMTDIFSAKAVFAWGFVGLGISNLIISFLPDKYSFLILRAFSGVAASAVIPASYRLIVGVFEPEELDKAFSLYGMSGALGAVTGSLSGGLVDLIPGVGQNIGWRWFFRIMAVVILPVAIGSFRWIPSPPSPNAPSNDKIRHLDLVGSCAMLAAVLLLILGLTLGATNGWQTPAFLVPFLLSFAIFPLFFLWEAKLPFDYALLPPSTWWIPNLTPLLIFALSLYAWVAYSNLPLIETFVSVNGDTSFIVAVRLLPMSLAGAAACIFLSVYPQYVDHPRWPIIIGMTCATGGYVLFALSNGAVGVDYWRYILPGQVIGGAGSLVVEVAVNVGVMAAVPPEMAGVAGAILQVFLQVGQVVGLALMAGLLSIQPGAFENWTNVRTVFIFFAGWGVVWLAGFLVFFRPGRVAAGADEKEEVGGR